ACRPPDHGGNSIWCGDGSQGQKRSSTQGSDKHKGPSTTPDSRFAQSCFARDDGGVMTLLRACDRQSCFEEFVHSREDFGRGLGIVDLLTQCGATRYAMREPGGELLHLASRVWQLFFDQHLEIGANHFVAISFGRLVVRLA